MSEPRPALLLLLLCLLLLIGAGYLAVWSVDSDRPPSLPARTRPALESRP